MRTSLWLAVVGALVSAGLSAGVAIGQEAVQMPGYYRPDGTPCGADGGPVSAPGRHQKAGKAAHPPLHLPIKGNRNAMYRAGFKPWHGPFYDPSYGAPVALVVPPTVERHSDYGWGVGKNRVSRIDAQFMRPYPGPGAAAASGYGFAPTPPWPSDTSQFGVYYVRGPW